MTVSLVTSPVLNLNFGGLQEPFVEQPPYRQPQNRVSSVTEPSADGVCYATGLRSDTKAIIGTIVGTGLVVAGLLSA